MMWNQKDLTEPRWIEGQVLGLNELFAKDGVEQILDWADENFSPSLYFECTFSSRDLILLEIMALRNIWPQVYVLSRNARVPNVLNLAEIYQNRGFSVSVFTESSLPHESESNIDKLERSQALSHASGWLVSQPDSAEPSSNLFEIDHQHDGILKIYPLKSWTEKDVSEYSRQNNLNFKDVSSLMKSSKKTKLELS